MKTQSIKKTIVQSLIFSLILTLSVEAVEAQQKYQIAGKVTQALIDIQEGKLDDALDRTLFLSRVEGVNYNSGKTEFMDGARVIAIVTSDTDRSNHTFQGYSRFRKEGDTVFQKIRMFDVIPLLHQTTVEDSIGILFCCGSNDEWLIYEANAALADTLDALGLPYEFYSHTGGHGMPNEFKQRAFYFLDSLLLPPAQNWVGIDKPARQSSAINLTIFPNPASHNATCYFELTHAGPVNIALLNHLGQELTIVYDGWMWPGRRQIEMNTAALPVGVYFCRVQIGQETQVQKIIKVQ